MKIVVIGVVVLFLGFWMVQSPDTLAAFTKDAGAWLWDTTSMVFTSLIGYLDTLFA
jgi:hypothetical protein